MGTKIVDWFIGDFRRIIIAAVVVVLLFSWGITSCQNRREEKLRGAFIEQQKALEDQVNELRKSVANAEGQALSASRMAQEQTAAINAAISNAQRSNKAYEKAKIDIAKPIPADPSAGGLSSSELCARAKALGVDCYRVEGDVRGVPAKD